MHPKKLIIIGCGFAGLSAACFLAKAGFAVTVLEKNEQPGGRARQLKIEGFTFDMGPSWYWMPDVFKHPFVLYFDGFKYAEIADMLSEPLGTIKSRIFFARKLLKEQIERF